MTRALGPTSSHAIYRALLLSIVAFPIQARQSPEAGALRPDQVSQWFQQQTAQLGKDLKEIEVRLANGTELKGILVSHAADRMVVNIRRAKPNQATPSGERALDYVDISEFSLRVGLRSPGLTLAGGMVGAMVGALPGMAVGLNDYGSSTTEKVGAVMAVAGAVAGAWYGSKLGKLRRAKVTVRIRP